MSGSKTTRIGLAHCERIRIELFRGAEKLARRVRPPGDVPCLLLFGSVSADTFRRCPLQAIRPLARAID